MNRAIPWIATAALVAAFFWLCAKLDGNDRHHGYPATVAPLPILETNHQAFLGVIMNYDNPDLDNFPSIDLQESCNEANACAQVEYDQQTALVFEPLPF